MAFSDSHCHLDSYTSDDLTTVFSQMKAKQVSLVLSVSISLETSEEVVKIAQSHTNVLAAIGIHPGEAIPLTERVRKRLLRISGEKQVVALGEIGLDYQHSAGNRDMQKELFIYQLGLAKHVQKPVDIHYSRDAHQDIINILKKERGPGPSGIVHGFQGTLSELTDWLELGFYISLGQTSVDLAKDSLHMSPLTNEVVNAIPAERLLIETDSIARMSANRWITEGLLKGIPKDSTPPGGKPSHEEFRQPADVIDVAAKIASIRNSTIQVVADVTIANFRHVLKFE